MFEMLRKCFEQAVRSGEIEPPDDIERVVWLVHAIFYAELRHCVGAGLSTAVALRRLDQSLRLFMRGGAPERRTKRKRPAA